LRDVDVDVVRDARRIDEHLDAVQDLLEQRAAEAHAFGRSDEHERDLDVTFSPATSSWKSTWRICFLNG
jgi:hypothetical protein